MNLGIALGLMIAAVAVALPVAAQQPGPACPAPRGSLAEGAFGGFKDSLLAPPCAEPSLPPLTARPTTDKAPPLNPPPAGPPLVADHHVASTDLGFERGIGPAPGRAVTWQGRKYVVVDVTTKDGRPTFAGGSRFIITTAGGSLDIGLKALGKGVRELEMADAIALN